jgi:hypothetical protein
MREEAMRKSRAKTSDDLRPEYDIRELVKRGERGKYASRYHAGTNVVLLDADVRKAFPTSKTVNDALRLVIELHKIGGRATRIG